MLDKHIPSRFGSSVRICALFVALIFLGLMLFDQASKGLDVSQPSNSVDKPRLPVRPTKASKVFEIPGQNAAWNEVLRFVDYTE